MLRYIVCNHRTPDMYLTLYYVTFLAYYTKLFYDYNFLGVPLEGIISILQLYMFWNNGLCTKTVSAPTSARIISTPWNGVKKYAMFYNNHRHIYRVHT